jgi:predicted regulator of Ras-like GTPase activity (Roadblock/LC7/MglB family)
MSSPSMPPRSRPAPAVAEPAGPRPGAWSTTAVPLPSLPQSRHDDANGIKGLIGACLVDSQSGEMLASEGNGNLDVDRVARLNAEFMRTWDYSVDQLSMDEPLDEILMTLETQIHLVRPLERFRSVFLYVALDKASCNLGMARLQLRQLEANLAT